MTGVLWDANNTPAPTVHGVSYIPVGRVALIRQYSATEFSVLLSHPEDASPQSLSYFRRETYNPGASVSVIHLPRHPTISGPILKHNTLITVTAANTIVYLWQEFLLPMGGYVYQFQNSSTTDILYKPGSGVTGFNGATYNGTSASYYQGVNSTLTIVIYSTTRNMALYDGTDISLPSVFRAGCGISASSDTVLITNTTSTGFVVPSGSASERAFYVYNGRGHDITFKQSGAGIIGTKIISSGRTAYIVNTGDNTWTVSPPIVHLPCASLDEDPTPDGCFVDITEPGTEIRVYAGDTRTIGYKWWIVNKSGTDTVIKAKTSGLGLAPPTLGNGDVVLVPDGRSALLVHVQSTRYTVFVNAVYRLMRTVTVNNAVLDGQYQERLVVLKMTGSGSPYIIKLDITNNLLDGATMEILNQCDQTVSVTSTPTVPILSRLGNVIIPLHASVLMRYVAGTGFLLVGDLV